MTSATVGATISPMEINDIPRYMAHVGAAARAAAASMAKAHTAQKNAALHALAIELRQRQEALSEANQQDLDAAGHRGLSAPMVDRLRLTPKVVATIAEGCEQLAAMPDPIGEITSVKRRPSGIQAASKRHPSGVRVAPKRHQSCTKVASNRPVVIAESSASATDNDSVG